MSTDPHTIERYRLAARACCRGLALFCALMVMSYIASPVMDLLLRGWPGFLDSSFFVRGGLFWGLIGLVSWRFDQRFARWLVPAPKPGHCPKCGYSLHGITGSPICPECGADLRPPPPPASA